MVRNTTPSHGIYGKFPDCIYNPKNHAKGWENQKLHRIFKNLVSCHRIQHNHRCKLQSAWWLCNNLKNRTVQTPVQVWAAQDIAWKSLGHIIVFCAHPRARQMRSACLTSYLSCNSVLCVAVFPQHSVCRWDWATRKLESNLQLGSRSNFNESQSYPC